VVSGDGDGYDGGGGGGGDGGDGAVLMFVVTRARKVTP